MKAISQSRHRILVVVAEMGRNSQREIAGISAWARDSGWTVDVVEGSHFGYRADFGKWIEFWRPDGLIVDPLYAGAALADAEAANLPLVVWDATAADAFPGRCARAMSDPAQIANAAARELLSTGFPRFAFVPALGNPLWSRERGAAFSNAIHGFGHPVASFTPPGTAANDASLFSAALSRFLSARRKPLGIFAANDVAAVFVRDACAALGLRIPQDVALLGVDDSAEYCERGEPSLSSVRIDIEGGGRAAAALLAKLVSGGDVRTLAAPIGSPIASYGVERVVRRASTSALTVFDARVARALEWIRLNALSPIGPADVVAVMGCSRRLADLNFRKASGRSILDEIHSRRLDEAKALLKLGDIPISEIPARCGYVPGPYLGILFKRATGKTMRRWRADWLKRHG